MDILANLLYHAPRLSAGARHRAHDSARPDLGRIQPLMSTGRPAGAPPERMSAIMDALNHLAKFAVGLFDRMFGSMDALTRIAKAAEGLLYSSEADYPLEPFSWTDPAAFSPAALPKLAGLPDSTKVTQQDAGAFFAPMLRVDDPESADARARAARFKKLARLLQRTLRDLTVYKLGAVEMPTFIVGQLADGTVAGLRTTVVET